MFIHGNIMLRVLANSSWLLKVAVVLVAIDQSSSTTGSKATWQVGTQPDTHATPALRPVSGILPFAEYQQKQNSSPGDFYKNVESWLKILKLDERRSKKSQKKKKPEDSHLFIIVLSRMFNCNWFELHICSTIEVYWQFPEWFY